MPRRWGDAMVSTVNEGGHPRIQSGAAPFPTTSGQRMAGRILRFTGMLTGLVGGLAWMVAIEMALEPVHVKAALLLPAMVTLMVVTL